MRPRDATPVRLIPEAVRGSVARSTPGAYVLGYGVGPGGQVFRPTYVGRSDVCVRTRLVSHAHAGRCDYFIVQYAADRHRAFLLECQFWHAYLQEATTLTNQVHPASPSGTALVCPYCEFARGLQAHPIGI